MQTTLPFLDAYIHLERRYSRSIVLERDLANPDSVLGYVITPKVQEVIHRFVASMHKGASRAWTITGVYGTGKSSAAHFIAALCSERHTKIYERSKDILKEALGKKEAKSLLEKLESNFSAKGLVRAVVTARREPIHHTVLRALIQGLEQFDLQKNTSGTDLLIELKQVWQAAETGEDFDPILVLKWINAIHQTCDTGILLVLDEMGKAFEYAAQYAERSDLFLLQKLAEFPSQNAKHGLFFFGLLHQAFSDYGHQATRVQQSEWNKVHGRFEDIPFSESVDQILRLMGHSIAQKKEIQKPLEKWSQDWYNELSSLNDVVKGISTEVLAKAYPLHPLAALVLPILCQRYAQNERSLFTFLGSGEPHALKSFLQHQFWSQDDLPTLKLAQVFDYFVESANLVSSSSLYSQRWIEIQNRLADAHHLEEEQQILLKTIGVLNLVSLSGSLRARKDFVLSAANNYPLKHDDPDYLIWDQHLQQLIDKGFVSFWERRDELRLWHGSDFDINEELRLRQEAFRLSPEEVFQRYCQLPPLVAQRHSYKTGNLRYFERHYLNHIDDLAPLVNPDSDADGFVYYLLQPKFPKEAPTETTDGRPILYLCSTEVQALIQRGLEVAALHDLAQNAPELRTDTVARKEVEYRLSQSQHQLEAQVFSVFHASEQVKCKTPSSIEHLKGNAHLRQILSEVLDAYYSEGLTLWNELLNRQELTSQGAKARRELIQYMLENNGKPALGIEGYGPERSMCESLLIEGGLYSKNDEGVWTFSEPPEDSGLVHVWNAMRAHCLTATDRPYSVADLFSILAGPPYGIKKGPLPVLLTALLQYYRDELSLFQDGTFIPVLGPEHFELLVRHPQRFAIKSFELAGFKISFFKELWKTLKGNQTLKIKGDHRNETLLALIKPLVFFLKKLPNYTHQTKRISAEAQAFRAVLANTQDPAELLFTQLPQVLGFEPIQADEAWAESQQLELSQKLVAILSELNQVYPQLLKECREHLETAFHINKSGAAFRDELTQRAHSIADKTFEPTLVRFFKAVLDVQKEDSQWLESVVMVIADKPPQQWKDQDLIDFKVALTQLKHLFINLEALHLEMGKTKTKDSKDAKRIVITDSSGKETRKLIWLSPQHRADAENLVTEFLNKHSSQNPELQEAFIALLAERILTPKES